MAYLAKGVHGLSFDVTRGHMMEVGKEGDERKEEEEPLDNRSSPIDNDAPIPSAHNETHCDT